MPNIAASVKYAPEKVNVSQSEFRWSVLLASLILALIVIPSFQSIFGYHLFRFLVPLFLLWIVVVSIEAPSIWGVIRHRIVELWIYGYWCTVVFLYAWMNMAEGVVINEIMGSVLTVFYILFQISVCYVMGFVYAVEDDKKTHQNLIRFLMIAVGANAVLALPALFDQQLAVRAYVNSYQSLTASDGPRLSVSTFALGGLGLYTLEALFTPYFIAIIFDSKRFIRIIYIGLFIAIAVNIFMSSLLLVQLCFLLGVASFLFRKMLSAGTPVGIRLGLVALTLLLTLVAVQFSNNPAMRYSTNRLIKYLNPSSTYVVRGDTLEDRKMLYADSITTFLAYPTLGIGFAAYIGMPIQAYQLGGHSGVFDGFGMYGFLFCIYILFLWLKFEHLRKLWLVDKNNTWVLSGMICFLTYMILITLNPFVFNSSVSGIFFFGVIAGAVPSRLDTYASRNKKITNEK